jgi:glutamyl-Q tRNA(Asp) synthetase
VDPGVLGDIVLARGDVGAAYHLAVVVDDAFQQVSLVTRGNDLFAATHVQRLLQALLGLREPQYAHHRLILDAQGNKLSKRDGPVTLRDLRARGTTAADVRRQLGF